MRAVSGQFCGQLRDRSGFNGRWRYDRLIRGIRVAFIRLPGFRKTGFSGNFGLTHFVLILYSQALEFGARLICYA